MQTMRVILSINVIKACHVHIASSVRGCSWGDIRQILDGLLADVTNVVPLHMGPLDSTAVMPQC